MNRNAGIAAALALCVVTACSAGTGPLVSTHAGPDDGTPGAFEPAGAGADPAGGFGDPSGSSGDDPFGGQGGGTSTGCLKCDGAYSCTETDSSKPETIALAPGQNGCVVVVAGSSDVVDTLTCDHQFTVVSQGSTVAAGTWSGDDSAFTITASSNGQSIVVSCTRTGSSSSFDAGQQATPGGGTTDTVDGG